MRVRVSYRVFVISYPSKRRLLVDSMALSTVRMACSMDVLTKVSPSLLTAGTVETQVEHQRARAEFLIKRSTSSLTQAPPTSSTVMHKGLLR